MISPGTLNITIADGKLFLGGYGTYIPADPRRVEMEIETFRYILAGIYAWLAWEHIVTFSVELQRWKQLLIKREVVLVNICVIVSRYLSWTNAIASAVFFFSNPFSCQATFTWIFFTYFLIWATTATIFIVRVQSLYPGKRMLHRMVWAAWVLVSCLWLVSLGFFYSARLPSEYWIPRMPQCTASPAPYWHVLGFGGSMCFDVLILALTVYSASKNFADRRIRHGLPSAQVWVLETAIIYAAVCFACNTALFFVWIFQKNVILRAYPIPFAIVVNPIVASRIVFHGATWGSKTALLESRLIKITEEDVLNWQRDPGVLGASPSSTAAASVGAGRRPSTKSGGGIGGDYEANVLTLPSVTTSKAVGVSETADTGPFIDERVGFGSLFAGRRGSNADAMTPSKANSETDSKRSSREIFFKKPIVAQAASLPPPPRANVRRYGAQPTERASASTASPNASYDSDGTMTGWRRDSDATVFDPLDRSASPTRVAQAPPSGWTVEEMLREDLDTNTRRHDSLDDFDADLERGLTSLPPQFSDRFDMRHARRPPPPPVTRVAPPTATQTPPITTPAANASTVVTPQERRDRSAVDEWITISQHISTQVD